jgi:short-subunit dehydrogenase
MKKIIITGGTKGIGKALVVKFAQEGFSIATCARSEADLEQLRKEFSIQFPQNQLIAIKADLSKKEEVSAFVNEVTKEWSNIDVLINNTGTFTPGEIHSEEDGNLEKMIETNLYSAYHLTRGVIPSMLTQKEGHIFNMCSVASIKAYANGGSYAISKFALLGMTKCLREEMKDKGVKVTAILPGATWSDSWSGADLPLERLMPAKDIADVIWGTYALSKIGVVEELIIRPQLGDL